MQHAKLSASSSSRWIACPSSILLSDLMADKYGEDVIFTSSGAANEGSLAHEVGEICLKNGKNAIDYIGHKGFGCECDLNMADFVQEYIDYVRSVGGKNFIEVRVDTSDYIPGGFGTADAIVIKGDTLHTIDLKFGRGVKVYAINNSQARIYALGALKTLINHIPPSIKNISMTIHQPRLDHVDTETITLSELFKWGENVLKPAVDAVMAVTSDNMVYNPSDSACKFCPAKSYCPGLYAETIALFEDAPEVEHITLDQLGELMPKIDMVESWCKAIKSRVMDELTSGKDVTGYKLVEGRSLRQWANEEQAESVLKTLVESDRLYTKKFVSPSQAEKILGKKTMAKYIDLVVKPTGKPAIASINSKKPAITSAKTDMSLLDD